MTDKEIKKKIIYAAEQHRATIIIWRIGKDSDSWAPTAKQLETFRTRIAAATNALPAADIEGIVNLVVPSSADPVVVMPMSGGVQVLINDIADEHIQ